MQMLEGIIRAFAKLPGCGFLFAYGDQLRDSSERVRAHQLTAREMQEDVQGAKDAVSPGGGSESTAKGDKRAAGGRTSGGRTAAPTSGPGRTSGGSARPAAMRPTSGQASGGRLKRSTDRDPPPDDYDRRTVSELTNRNKRRH